MKLKKLNHFHFLLTIVLFGVITWVIGQKGIQDTFPDNMDDYLIELTSETFMDSTSSSECFVLFYTEDSPLSPTMQYNLNQLAKSNQGDGRFFKLDVGKYPESVTGYNISGVPNVFIFREGKEYKRIMGVVSPRNLELIYSRL